MAPSAAMRDRFWSVFSSRLRTARLAAGYSQEAVEVELHIGRRMMTKWEHGRRRPVWPLLRRVCLMLGVGPETLFPPLERWHPTGVRQTPA